VGIDVLVACERRKHQSFSKIGFEGSFSVVLSVARIQAPSDNRTVLSHRRVENAGNIDTFYRLSLISGKPVSDGVTMLNDRSEIHRSCRHTARFHRLCMRSGTDDPS
jgi:hypothetical protein